MVQNASLRIPIDTSVRLATTLSIDKPGARINGMCEIRTRIAPSPTGNDLHIGNAYTSLINFVFAKKHKGKFIIRIEDTDRTRLVPGSEDRILASLKWLGLKHDEGPDKGGPFTPYRQSERLAIYKEYAEKLVASGHAYYCFCTSERLEQMRAQQQAKKMPPMYDGICRKLDRDESAKRVKTGEKHTVRLKVKKDGTTSFHDLIRGDISFENKLIDDQVILKSDEFPTYHLGVVVDDYLMKISHVIRGEEWISSTPKHIMLYEALGWEKPVFAHLPLLRSPDKSKLSKRKNPVWVSWYKEQGILPEALINYLGLMGWSMADGRDLFSVDDMIAAFTLEDVKTTAPIFDTNKLEWLNGHYLMKTPDKLLADDINEFYPKKLDLEIIRRSVPLIKERIKKLADYLPLCRFLFEQPVSFETDLVPKKEMLKKVADALEKITDWQANAIGGAMQNVQKTSDSKSTDFFMAIRVAVTGRMISPPLNESMEILGKNEVLARLQSIIAKV